MRPLLLLVLLSTAACRSALPGETADTAAAPLDDTGDAQDTDEVDPAETGTGAPYPIVLCHGYGGFSDLGNLGLVDYFFGVREALADEGELLVFTPEVDPVNDSLLRGAQLAEQLEAIVATTGHARVNLVGHSQGGLDARVAAALRPDLVASVTTIGTPHEGTPIADVGLGFVESPLAQDIIDWLLVKLGGQLYDALGEQTSFYQSIWAFSEPGIAALDAAAPDQPGTRYFSLAGRTDHLLGLPECQADSPPFIAQYDLVVDPVDPLFAITESVLDGPLGLDANDGMVRVVDAKHGTWLGCVPADHGDLIGQVAGDNPGLANPFDHRAFYVDLVAWLRTQEL